MHQLLQRWWYALPKWPPDNLDVSEKLKENKLRLVEEKNWKKGHDLLKRKADALKAQFMQVTKALIEQKKI